MKPGCNIPSAFHWQGCQKAGKDSSPASSLNLTFPAIVFFSATPWSPVEPKTNNKVVTLQKRKVKLSLAAEEPSLDSDVCCRKVTCHSTCPLLLGLCKEGEVRGEEGARLCVIADEMKMTLSSSGFCFEQCCVSLGGGLGFH